MKIIKLLALATVLVFPAAARQKLFGFCEQGNITVSTLTAVSTTKVQGSYPSCTVTVYLAGSNTLATIFSDNSGTTLANPFTATTSGQWGFFANDGAYDVRFSGGGLPSPWTRSGAGLFDGSPSSQGTSGTVPRTIKDKLKDFLSVKDFGAIGDGSTDDTVAIQTAVDASVVANLVPHTSTIIPGVCIYFPDGVYRVTAQIISNLHTACLVGDQWRLLYTGSSHINAVLSIIGGPSVFGEHGDFIEGSIVDGAILDGQGNASYAFLIQAVVSAQINYMRTTNITVAGVSCNWCQQTTFERLQASADFERFLTAPQYGIIIDNNSSANILHQVNIDHVTVDGIWLRYALNTLISGGTSEGNGGLGVRCDGDHNPLQSTFRVCTNNTFIQLDVEANSGGDFYFGANAFFNSAFATNSSSVVGIVFDDDAHLNTFHGGAIGASVANAGTYGNSINSVGSFSQTDPVWTDHGQNMNTRIRNQSTGIFQDAANNFNIENNTRFSAAGNGVSIYTPSDQYTEVTVGKPGGTWIGLSNQDGLAGWLTFKNASPGMCFISQITYRGTSVPEGCIVGHNWGFGTFNSAPVYKFHFLDGSITKAVFQSAPGQGTNSLVEFRDKVTLTSPLLSAVDYLGAFNGPVTARHTGSVVGTVGDLPTCAPAIEGRMEPVNDNTTTDWGVVVVGGGTNHILAYCDGSGQWAVMGAIH